MMILYDKLNPLYMLHRVDSLFAIFDTVVRK